jgi:hypothetical protein
MGGPGSGRKKGSGKGTNTKWKSKASKLYDKYSKKKKESLSKQAMDDWRYK